MFAYLKGYVAYSGKDFVVIDVNGIGYKVYTANPYEFRKGRRGSSIYASSRIRK